LNPSIALTPGSKGTWTDDEDLKLQGGAVQIHGDKDWVANAALVPGRTNDQCFQRWRNNLDPSIDWANGRANKWREDEDLKLKNSVEMHGGKD
jgi:myb proto-oncogene protein